LFSQQISAQISSITLAIEDYNFVAVIDTPQTTICAFNDFCNIEAKLKKPCRGCATAGSGPIIIDKDPWGALMKNNTISYSIDKSQKSITLNITNKLTKKVVYVRTFTTNDEHYFYSKKTSAKEPDIKVLKRYAKSSKRSVEKQFFKKFMNRVNLALIFNK
jgi:hypothetical protein